jgi:hypothetical protein
MLVLVTQSLAGRQVTGVIFNLLETMALALLQGLGGSGDLAVVLEQLLEELGAKDGDLGEEQLALDQSRVGVVQNGPDGDEIIQLAASLLDNTILALQHDGHAGQIIDLGLADHQTVNVEATGGQDTGHTGQHTGLVLNQAVKNMALRRVARRHGSLVQNRRDGGRSIPLGRGVGDRQGERRAAVQCLVGQSRGRAARGGAESIETRSCSGTRPSSSCRLRQQRR